ncbi:hypothetical protein KC19_11G029200 [Ceratodon purpureus]|uniref:Glycosyltransferases n=1 Tax=Ceratodon purpureus TaxID=3225 RepID=A0A8T0GG31_CERPU|nr:hypothetical protein KC19_11G029200 [Ceratodon purpureus]
MRTGAGPPRLSSRTVSLTNGGAPRQLTAACVRFNYASASRLFLHTVFCIASVVLGFRISQEISLVVLQFNYVEDTINWFDRNSEDFENFTTAQGLSDPNVPGLSDALEVHETIFDSLPHPDARLPGPLTGLTTPLNASKKTGVQVGRHRILIREWPHPDPSEMMEAYNLIARVQQEQRRLHSVQDWKPVIAITPTYARMFQALHLTGLMHTLSLVRGPVTWIVIEAGGTSKVTAELLSEARVHNVVHLGYPKPMPDKFEARWILESHLRVEGLRFVREKKLEGVVVFADDSNVYSMEFFNLIQKVNWVGVLPMGILGYAGFQDGNNAKSRRRRRGSLLLGVVHKGQVPPKIDLQVQTLAAGNRNGTVDGWHAHRPLPLDWDSGKGTSLLDNRLQWAGFVINARAFWTSEHQTKRPPWLKDWKLWARLKDGVYLDLRSILKDESQVEQLADVGPKDVVRHWWIRMEGRPDFKFPPRWTLDSQPDIVLPARSSPWPEVVLNSTSPSRSTQMKTSSLDSNKSPARDG